MLTRYHFKKIRRKFNLSPAAAGWVLHMSIGEPLSDRARRWLIARNGEPTSKAAQALEATLTLIGDLKRMEQELGRFVIYYAEDSQGRVKIGKSRNVPVRISTLRREHDGGIKLLAIEPDTGGLELKRHQEFIGDLIRGTWPYKREWFTKSPSLAKHIKSLQ